MIGQLVLFLAIEPLGRHVERPRGDAVLAQPFARAVIFALDVLAVFDITRRVDVLVVLDLVEHEREIRPEALDPVLRRRRLFQPAAIALANDRRLQIDLVPNFIDPRGAVLRILVIRVAVGRVLLEFRLDVDLVDLLDLARRHLEFFGQPLGAGERLQMDAFEVDDHLVGAREAQDRAFTHDHFLVALQVFQVQPQLLHLGRRLFELAFLDFAERLFDARQLRRDIVDLADHVGAGFHDALVAELDPRHLADLGAAHSRLQLLFVIRSLFGQVILPQHRYGAGHPVEHQVLLAHLRDFGQHRHGVLVDRHHAHGLRRQLHALHRGLQAVLAAIPNLIHHARPARGDGFRVPRIERRDGLVDVAGQDRHGVLAALVPFLGRAVARELLVLAHLLEGLFAALLRRHDLVGPLRDQPARRFRNVGRGVGALWLHAGIRDAASAGLFDLVFHQ